jgi:uncharacterized membrane protein YoaK (UPF0700 family)
MITRILTRFSLQAAKWDGPIELALLLVWMAVLACVVSSIFSQAFDRKQRIFWIAVVVLLPALGLLAYLPFAFHSDDLPLMFRRKPKRSKQLPHAPTDSDT